MFDEETTTLKNNNDKNKSDIKHRESKKNKQSPSAFVLFCKDMRKTICLHCPYFSPPDVSKVLSERWKSLPYTEKEQYRDKANELAILTSKHSNCKIKEERTPKIITKQFILPSIETFDFPNLSLNHFSENHFNILNPYIPNINGNYNMF